eukprot:gene6239-12632_t
MHCKNNVSENSHCFIRSFDIGHGLSDNVISHITTIASESIMARDITKAGLFSVALSGGSMITLLNKLVHTPNIQWESWKIFFADERCLPFDNDESTFGAYNRQIFSKIDIPASNIFHIENFDDPSFSASLYDAKFRQAIPDGTLDLVLLGMGPDGHTASLFPGHELLQYTGPHAIMPIFDSPKPPPCRITMTLGTINAARQVTFITTGLNKADILTQILHPHPQPSSTDTDMASAPALVSPDLRYPCSLIRPQGTLTWILDMDASSGLSFCNK